MDRGRDLYHPNRHSHPQRHTRAGGYPEGDEGAESTALACILVFPQEGLVVRNGYSFVLVLCLSGFPPAGVSI